MSAVGTMNLTIGTEIAHVRWLEDLSSDDVALVGGKNASLGEMIRELAEAGVRVPGGFATTAGAYREFVEANGIEGDLRSLLDDYREGRRDLDDTGRAIRDLFLAGEIPRAVAEEICGAYRELSEREGGGEVAVAVRSSATAEDLPQASFAGQQETFLNVTGEEALLAACRRCFASLFTDRAIAYRDEQGFDHLQVALSVGVQKMVRSDLAGAGVLFTIDTETGFPNNFLINAAWGLGETVVKGIVDPDQYTVFKPFLDDPSLVPVLDKDLGTKEQKLVYTEGSEGTEGTEGAGPPGADPAGETTRLVETSEEERRAFVLSDEEILTLARWGGTIEEHYGRPMDVEWAKDGESGELHIVQARPETVQSRLEAAALRSYRLEETGERLVSGLAIGQAIAAGPVCRLESAAEIEHFRPGSVLVTGMTDPDWVPIMKRAAGIVTDHGGRTSHAAIVSRELGIPAVVGTGRATEVLEDGREVTLSCAEGDEGHVYDGRLRFSEEEIDLKDVPGTRTRVMLNIASPPAALRWWRLPCRGVGLARMEYLINNVIQIHPLALTRFDAVDDADARRRIEELTRGYDDKTEYFVDHLARGIATVAASQHPDPVIVRTSDFKTNEYADLIGGRRFEPDEENPMLGWRGAARYYDDDYRDGFALECRA
ncbi:MAG: phosphoenolpyruvate synthase, partial [Acidobacteriota bacterium]